MHASKSEEANIKLAELVAEKSILYEGKILFVQQGARFKTFFMFMVPCIIIFFMK